MTPANSSQSSQSSEDTPVALDVLVVDGDELVARTLTQGIEVRGHNVFVAPDPQRALELACSRGYDLIVADVDSDGFSLLSRVRFSCPATEVVLTSAKASIEEAVAATKARARYLAKPIDSSDIDRVVDDVADSRRVAMELQGDLESAVPALVGRCSAMMQLKHQLQIIARADGSVLISGETGSGKSLVAERLHAASSRCDGPMVTVNCAAFAGAAVEAELFGPDGETGGGIEAACGGTLLLDDVDEMSLAAQARLLAVLRGGRNGDGARPLNARVVSATSRDLAALVTEGRFRSDLYAELKVFRLDIPPLRMRNGDLPLLVEHIMNHLVGDGGPRQTLSPGAWAVLQACEFRGNVRQLEHALRYALAFAQGQEIRVEHLPPDMLGASADARRHWNDEAGRYGDVVALSSALTEFEHEYLLQVLERTDGNRSLAASLLGISRKSLWAKLKRYRERTPSFAPVRT